MMFICLFDGIMCFFLSGVQSFLKNNNLFVSDRFLTDLFVSGTSFLFRFHVVCNLSIYIITTKKE